MFWTKKKFEKQIWCKNSLPRFGVKRYNSKKVYSKTFLCVLIINFPCNSWTRSTGANSWRDELKLNFGIFFSNFDNFPNFYNFLPYFAHKFAQKCSLGATIYSGVLVTHQARKLLNFAIFSHISAQKICKICRKILAF